MTKRYLLPALIFGVAGLAMFGLAPRSEWLEVGMAFAVLVLLMSALMTPAIRDLARDNKGATRTAGLISIGFAACVLVADLVSSSPFFDAELTAEACTILLFLGLLLLQLPRMSANVDSALQAQKVAARVRPTVGGFIPLREVEETYAYVWRNKASLARVAAPWLLVFCVLPALLIHPKFWAGVVGQNGALALRVLVGLGVLLLVEFCLVLVVAIQWTRFVVTGCEPRWSNFPGKALWGLLWRWIIFGSVFRAIDQIDPWLKAHLAGASTWELLALDKLCLFAILVLASPFALALPPIALGEPGRSTTARTLTLGIAGRKFYLGSALILAPFFVLFFLADLVFAKPSNLSIAIAMTICDVALVLCLVVVGVTYVTRIYAKGASATA